MAFKRKKKTADGESAPVKPKKQRRYHQLREVYQMTVAAMPQVRWLLLAVFFGILLLGIGIGLIIGHPVYLGLLGLLVAVLATMFVLTNRAEKAAYSRIEGQAGAAGAALGTIRRGWSYEEEPVAIDPRTQDLVFRAIGRPGVALISEGPPHRAARMLERERRKVARVAPGVTILEIQVGREDGQIPLPRLVKHMRSYKNTLTKLEVDAVAKRLRALGHSRPPIPRGVDPMRARPDRRAMRGR